VCGGVQATHAAWCSRQYRTFAELLAARAPPSAQPLQPFNRDQSPGFYFHAAAGAMIQCRSR